jgi:hypothetical protein
MNVDAMSVLAVHCVFDPLANGPIPLNV